jgi:hypothetical protein
MIEYDCQHSKTMNEDHFWMRTTRVVVIRKINA